MSQRLSFPALFLDTGYQEPSRAPQNVLLFCFIGLLSVLSILCTALLLWKKVGVHTHAGTAVLPRHPSLSTGRAPEDPGAACLPCTVYILEHSGEGSWNRGSLWLLAPGPSLTLPVAGPELPTDTMSCKKPQLFSLCCPGSSPFSPAPGFINHLPGIWVSLLSHSAPHALA